MTASPESNKLLFAATPGSLSLLRQHAMHAFRSLFVFTILVIAFHSAPLRAENWPQWRGAKLDGVSHETSLPTKWSKSENVVWRLLGVRLGSKVFDDGCYIPERTLVSIGNDCTLNEHSVIQCHSMEDGTFKSDYSTLGAGCTVGVGAHIHYGVTMGDGAVLEAHSFLMKGEEVPAHARWGGNPASELAGSQAGRLGARPWIRPVRSAGRRHRSWS